MGTDSPSTTDAARRPRSRVRGYGVAVVCIGASLLATLALHPAEIRGPLFIPSVLLAAWYGGLGPGLVAVVLSVLAIDLFLTTPRFSLTPVSVDDAVYLFAFSFAVSVVAWLTGTQRRVAEALRRAQAELTARMQEIEWANARLRDEVAERERIATDAQKQASLLDLTHDAIFVRDARDVITFWNRGAVESYGWSRDEAIGQVSHQLLRTEFPTSLAAIEEELHRTGRWHGELVHAGRDGSKLVVASRWSLQRDAEGRPTAILETNNDISERIRVEAALRRQANLLEQTHDAIVVWELGGTISYWNRGAAHLYGYAPDEAVGHSIHTLLHTRHSAPVGEFEATIEREGSWAGELAQTTRDGQRVVVDSRQVLVHEEAGRRSVLETDRDVTERKRAEAARDEARTALAHVARVATLGEITASIAHEVNQPLAAVVMNANACRRWLASDPPNLAEAREAAERIVRDGTRAGQVVARVRALARGGTPEPRPLDVNDVVRESLTITAGELAQHGVSLRTDLAIPLPWVLGDRVQLQQVLVNLILNAVEAMEVVDEDHRVLMVRSRREDSGLVCVEIIDCGTGIDPVHPERVFEAFFSTKVGGLGLGLSISRSIVEAHGGTIRMVPNEGAGATVSFTLPPAP